MKRFISAVILLFSATSSFAQYEHSSAFQRLELGVSYLVTKATFHQSSNTFIYENFATMDTSFSQRVKPKSSLGFTIGTSFHLADIGENGSLSLSVAGMVNTLSWEYQKIATLPYGTNRFVYGPGQVIEANTMQMGLPIGIDIKRGAEAHTDRSKRTLLSVGTGFNPYMSSTTFEGESGSSFNVHPYLKAEVGVVAGICVKVRALYTFGTVKYLSYSNRTNLPTYTTEDNVSFTGKSKLALSFIFMPISTSWNKKSWWR